MEPTTTEVSIKLPVELKTDSLVKSLGMSDSEIKRWSSIKEISDKDKDQFELLYQAGIEFCLKHRLSYVKVFPAVFQLYGREITKEEIEQELLEIFFPQTKKNDSYQTLLLVGGSKDGMSTLANHLVGTKVAKTHEGTTPATNEVALYVSDEYHLNIIDTPGFNAARPVLKNEAIVEEIEQKIFHWFKFNGKINAVVVVWNPKNNPKPSIMNCLEELSKRFSSDILDSCILMIQGNYRSDALNKEKLEKLVNENIMKMRILYPQIPIIEYDSHEQPQYNRQYENLRRAVNTVKPFTEKIFQRNFKSQLFLFFNEVKSKVIFEQEKNSKKMDISIKTPFKDIKLTVSTQETIQALRKKVESELLNITLSDSSPRKHKSITRRTIFKINFPNSMTDDEFEDEEEAKTNSTRTSIHKEIKKNFVTPSSEDEDDIPQWLQSAKFLYKGKILEPFHTLEELQIPDYATILFGKKTTISIKHYAGQTSILHVLTGTNIGELKEMLFQIGIMNPSLSEEILLNGDILANSVRIGELNTQGQMPSLEIRRKLCRILALDGGGTRGAAVARILEEIETATGKRIHELFDVIVGTSTGGLIALMMSVPQGNNKGIMTGRDSKNIYFEKGNIIFPPDRNGKLAIFNQLIDTKYSAEGLENVVLEIYPNEITMANAIVPVGVVATDLDRKKGILINSLRAKIHPDDYRHNIPIWKAARTTSAAPSYLKPVTLSAPSNSFKRAERSPSPVSDLHEPPNYTREKITLEDGGTSKNNPSKMGIKLAKACMEYFGYEGYQYQLVSIGTGSMDGKDTEPPKHSTHTGSLKDRVASGFLEDPFNIQQGVWKTHHKVMDKYFQRKEGPGTDYFRVQFKINEHQWNHLDDASLENLDSLVNHALNYLFTDQRNKIYSPHFAGLIDTLKQSTIKPDFSDISKRKFNKNLYDYFHTTDMEKLRDHPTLLKDIYQVMQSYVERENKYNEMQEYNSMPLLTALESEIGHRIIRSITSFIKSATHSYLTEAGRESQIDMISKDWVDQSGLKRNIINGDHEDIDIILAYNILANFTTPGGSDSYKEEDIEASSTLGSMVSQLIKPIFFNYKFNGTTSSLQNIAQRCQKDLINSRLKDDLIQAATSTLNALLVRAEKLCRLKTETSSDEWTIRVGQNEVAILTSLGVKRDEIEYIGSILKMTPDERALFTYYYDLSKQFAKKHKLHYVNTVADGLRMYIEKYYLEKTQEELFELHLYNYLEPKIKEMQSSPRANKTSSSYRTILLLGRSGDGKSNFVNHLVGKKVATITTDYVGLGATRAVETYVSDKAQFYLIDTPGISTETRISNLLKSLLDLNASWFKVKDHIDNIIIMWTPSINSEQTITMILDYVKQHYGPEVLKSCLALINGDWKMNLRVRKPVEKFLETMNKTYPSVPIVYYDASKDFEYNMQFQGLMDAIEVTNPDREDRFEELRKRQLKVAYHGMKFLNEKNAKAAQGFSLKKFFGIK